MAGRPVQPLSERLGLPDVFPHLPGCPEDQLSPEVLAKGYRHSDAAALGFTPARELQLTLTDQPPAFYSAASVAYWRKSLRQQLQGPARQLADKRRAGEQYDAPLTASATLAEAAAAAAVLPPPRFPQQSGRGLASGREAAEAWVREQLAAQGAPPLRELGWGEGRCQLPHGFPRDRVIPLLAELTAPLPRALWLLRVLALNRTRPAGWGGASEAEQRSRQLTEDLLAFLEAAATPAPATGKPPLPGGAQPGAAGFQEGAMPAAWGYGVQLAGHCCAAGLLDAGRAAEWAASSGMLLQLPSAGRREALALLERCLLAAPLAQQQALALAKQCLQGAAAVAAAASSEASSAAAAGGQATPRGRKQLRQQAELEELQRDLLAAAARVVELHPAAFVAADDALLQPLLPLGGRQAACVERVAAARRRLSRALHARVLHWHDAKAHQLLDSQLQAGASPAEAAAALCKLVSQLPEAAAENPAAAAAALRDAVRLACEWAAAAPAADFGAALAAAAGLDSSSQTHEQQQQPHATGAAALVPERVLFSLALLQALHSQQQQQQQPDVVAAQPPLQAALSSWLHGCAHEPQQPSWRQQRLLHLALLLAEAGLLCPALYLRSCLAAGALQAAAAASSRGQASDGGSRQPSLSVEVLEQLHPLLDFPSLQAGCSHSWPTSRQQYAVQRAAVLARHGSAAAAAAAAAAASAAEAAEEAEWEHLCAAPAADSGSSSGSENGSGGGPTSSRRELQHMAALRQCWEDPLLHRLQQQLLTRLGIAAAPGDPADMPPFAALLEQARQLQPWQQRHTAHVLLAAAKAFIASTDCGGGGGGRPSPTPPPGTPPVGSPPSPDWLLQLLAVLRACCAHREALSLLATALNLLQRAVAAAARAATASGQQAPHSLADALSAAQQQWGQRSGVPPPQLLALLAAHAGALAAADISAKLLPMLTGGLWRLQQAAQQQQARESLAGQRALAAQLVAAPGGASVQQWLGRMQQQHGAGHWVVADLAKARQAAASSAPSPSQQQLQQQGAARLEAFLQRARQLPLHAAAEEGGVQQGASQLLLLTSAAAAGGGNSGAAAALAAVQHSLEPAVLPALLQQLGGAQQPDLAQQLLGLSPAAAAALLSDPQQAYACLQHHPHHAAGATGSGAAAAAWQAALALFGASGGCCGDFGGSGSSGTLLRLSSSEAMAAAVSAATPQTARCCWLLLRLLLDEQQRQGGHRLAEAERQLAARVAHQAVLRPQAAAALAATLCSLSPSAAAGQQLLQEVEGLLRPPVVDLSPRALQAAGRQSLYHAGSAVVPAAPPGAPELAVPVAAAPPPPPFAAEQGLVDAALVCLSTGSSGERQHAFAQQLIRQLAALGDALLQQSQHGGSGAAHGHAPASLAAAATVASPAVVQVSVWARLALLLPLLPLIYKHRAADASSSLRGQLLRALLRLLAAPAVRADAAHARAAAAGTPDAAAAEAAAAAAEAAGEPLPQRLLHLLRALLVGGWASWMRLEGGKLRDVPAFEHSPQLAAEAAALLLPADLQAAVQAAMPVGLQQGLAEVPACQTVRGGASSGAPSSDCSSTTLSLDPWLLLEGGAGAEAGVEGTALAAAPGPAVPAAAAGVPPWLGGAVKRRRRDLCCWPAPQVAAAGPATSVEEQLQQRAAGADAVAANG